MTDRLSPQREAEIAARAEAATAGPWCTDSWEIYQGAEYEPGISQWIGETCRGTTSPEQDRADAAFVAAAREDVPALLAELAAVRKERDEAQARVRSEAADDIHRAELPKFAANESPELVAKVVRAVDVRLAEQGPEAPYGVVKDGAS